MSVIWMSVIGYEGFYDVSSDGRVRSLDRLLTQKSARAGKTVPLRRKGKELAPSPRSRDNRAAVSLSRDNRTCTRPVHVLVCEAFHGPRPIGMQACHNNGDYKDNQKSNLRWDTPKANQADRVLHGTNRRGEGIGTSKLKESDVVLIRGGMQRAEAIRRFGIGPTQFHRIKRGESWVHV